MIPKFTIHYNIQILKRKNVLQEIPTGRFVKLISLKYNYAIELNLQLLFVKEY